MKKLLLLFLLSLSSSVRADLLPPPYDSAEILPFDEHGWYGHAAFFQDYIPKNNVKTIIEVGSWLGASTRHMAKCLPEDGVIYAVDHWQGSSEHQPGEVCWRSILPKLYECFLSNVIHEGLTAKIIPVRMESLIAAEVLPVQADIVYIDASHDFEAVYCDLKAWFPHVAPGGILCGDDWGHPPIVEAVKRFAQEQNIYIELNSVFILRKNK